MCGQSKLYSIQRTLTFYGNLETEQENPFHIISFTASLSSNFIRTIINHKNLHRNENKTNFGDIKVHDMTPSLIIRGRPTQDEMVWACSTHVSVDIFNRKACGEDTTRRSRSRWQTNIIMGINVVIR